MEFTDMAFDVIQAEYSAVISVVVVVMFLVGAAAQPVFHYLNRQKVKKMLRCCPYPLNVFYSASIFFRRNNN